MFYQIMAAIILGVFYSIYFAKMFVQKCNGIKTDQITNKNKNKHYFNIEASIKVAAYSVLVVEVISMVLDLNYADEFWRKIGICISTTGIFIFLLAVVTMQDSWRVGIPESKETKLVTSGIYGISRNPAFLAFYLIYIGILLIFLNPILLTFTLFAIAMLHLQISQEEEFMAEEFGDEYIEYKNKVCMYVGKRNINKKDKTKFFNVPWHLWLVAAFFIFIYANGIYDYYMVLGQNADYYAAKGYGQTVMKYFDTYPTPFLILYTLNIYAGITAPIILLIRKKAATVAAGISAVSDILLLIFTFLMRDRFNVLGPEIAAFDIGIAILTICLYFYCRRMQKNNVLK